MLDRLRSGQARQGDRRCGQAGQTADSAVAIVIQRGGPGRAVTLGAAGGRVAEAGQGMERRASDHDHGMSRDEQEREAKTPMLLAHDAARVSESANASSVWRTLGADCQRQPGRLLKQVGFGAGG